MGSPQKDHNVFHLSHPHPLEPTTSNPTGNGSCFGCKLKITSGKEYYRCISCGFSLHYVCYKMPIIIHHPAHSRHDLVLLVIRSSAATKGTLKCVACGLHITGFCYHCGECTNIYFHTFCLALPLSLSVNYHPHNVKLEFSPPYDFFCDLCMKPSYKGWLYRCSICEFDTHLACAVENIEPRSFQHPSFSQSNTLLRQITSPQVTHMRFNASLGDSRIGYEIMHLVAELIGGGINRRSEDQEDFGSAVTGWDKRISSPREKHNTGSGKTKIVELQPTESSPAGYSANLEERTPLRDKLTPRSDMSTTPSYQFSDACFSIDLAKPYQETKGVTEGKGTSVYPNTLMPKRILSNSGQTKEPFDLANLPSFNSYNTEQQNRLRATFLNGGRISEFKQSSQKATNQTITKSDSGRYSSRTSCWRKFLSCCL